MPRWWWRNSLAPWPPCTPVASILAWAVHPAPTKPPCVRCAAAWPAPTKTALRKMCWSCRFIWATSRAPCVRSRARAPRSPSGCWAAVCTVPNWPRIWACRLRSPRTLRPTSCCRLWRCTAATTGLRHAGQRRTPWSRPTSSPQTTTKRPTSCSRRCSNVSWAYAAACAGRCRSRFPAWRGCGATASARRCSRCWRCPWSAVRSVWPKDWPSCSGTPGPTS